MLRAVVSKRLLDRMIREKLGQLVDCHDVQALPVVWRARLGMECNWEVPGWTGRNGAVKRCSLRIAPYIEFLGQQFDIPDEAAVEG